MISNTFIIIYLALGFIYSLYVVMNKGGGVFSIPFNTVFGPIYLPLQALVTIIQAYRGRSQRRKQNALDAKTESES